MADVFFLALTPWRLGNGIRVRAALHNFRGAGAEHLADSLEPRLAALILYCIVQQRGDGVIFIAAMREDNRCYTEQVGNVRACGSLAELSGMQPRRIHERAVESAAEPALRRFRSLWRGPAIRRRLSNWSSS